MKIIFLGTNGWYDTSLGNTICTLIKTHDFYIILDAGNGLYKIDRHITDEKPNPTALIQVIVPMQLNWPKMQICLLQNVHLSPVSSMMEAESQAKKIFDNTFVTIDDMEIEL